MPRTMGSLNKSTVSIKRAVEQAFKTVNGKNNAGLVKLAREEPKIFYNLVGRCIPAQVAVSVTAHIDLGQAMIEADERIKAIENTGVIDADVIESELDKRKTAIETRNTQEVQELEHTPIKDSGDT